MKVGSLCSGYGGLDLAIESIWPEAEVSWFSEFAPAPAEVFTAHWPGVPNLGDLTETDWSDVEPVDALTAGYPCQPFSHAGMRKGEEDERHLWPFIAEAIGVLRPRSVVLENVAGHLSLGGVAVVGDLASLGYDARWLVVRASDVGACHRRARWFCVARNSESWRGGRASSVAIEAGETRSRLEVQVAMLPTPMARDWKDRTGESWGTPSLADLALLPTPKATNNENRSSEWANGPNLGEALRGLIGESTDTPSGDTNLFSDE